MKTMNKKHERINQINEHRIYTFLKIDFNMTAKKLSPARQSLI